MHQTGATAPICEPDRARRKQRDKDYDINIVSLRQRLEEAGQANFDARVSVAPILALIEQGCDLEADILPVVAPEVPELPRPLKSWGAKWLAQEILAARERRLGLSSLPPMEAMGMAIAETIVARATS
jgi:hypothetical protein